MALPWLDQLLAASRGEDDAAPIGWRATDGARASAPPSDDALWQSLRAEDEPIARQAFATLFLRHTDRMYAVAAAVLRSRDAARDAVQDVMFRLWQRRTTLESHVAVRGYLSSAAYNAARDAQKATARLHEREAHSAMQQQIQSPYSLPGEVDDIPARVNAAVLALPGRTGDVFRLWWNGLSYAEVASAMGITVKGVERARARALAILADTLVDLKSN